MSGRNGSDDNRANQMNPNHDAYWQSRGMDERPEDWENQVADGDDKGAGEESSRK